MISQDQFYELVRERIQRDLTNRNNRAQYEAVAHSGKDVLMLVAGPGSGKTTVLVLRALRGVFVDGLLPERILITTFTRKAAKELRTRWLDWGAEILEALKDVPGIENIDINRCRIDTLDSIAEQVLTEFRPAGTVAPIVAEAAAASLIFKRVAFQRLYRENEAVLNTFYARYTFESNEPRNQGEALGVAKRLVERIVQDRINVDAYEQSGLGPKLTVEMLRRFKEYSNQTDIVDFTLLEERFLEHINSGELAEWLTKLELLLIDEYQDTNPLQEKIYFSLIAKAEPEVVVVGDDDQSMYRFRGGSVELFTQLAERCAGATGRATSRIDMLRNYRSRLEIIEFYNSHITVDEQFSLARISPEKPLVQPDRESRSMPVLGMFRPSTEQLAADLSNFLADLFTNRRITMPGVDEPICVLEEGNLGDAVVLAHSIEEIKFNHYNRTPEHKFPFFLRSQMAASATRSFPQGLKVFNPRGQALRTIPDVGKLLGLIILAVDPKDVAIDAVMPTNEARHYLRSWRSQAEAFVQSNPVPNDGRGLAGFILDWQKSAEGEVLSRFPRDWPVLELLFKLITWIPAFQTEPEHQVWLEAIARVIAGAGMASPYSMQLLNNHRASRGEIIRQVRQLPNGEEINDVEQSRLSLIRDALIPIAQNEVDVDEDILASVPRDHLQLMTIHQAKGLEFPLVIVDVGSHFKINSPKQRFRRFPEKISNTVQEEEDFEPFISGGLRQNRSGIDRTFDDLVRLYYVAFSRPQSVLLLVGHEGCLKYGKGRDLKNGIIPNVAIGWRRDGIWSWRQEFKGKRPPVLVEPPLLRLI